MNWRRGKAYSQDLRERVLSAVDGGMPVYEAAPLFQVSVSYIYKARLRRQRTGETSTRPQRCQLGRALELPELPVSVSGSWKHATSSKIGAR